LRSVLETALRSLDASLSRFSRVEDCLRELAEKPFDLLIIDLEGCEAEGLEMLGEVRRLAPWLSCLALVEHADVPGAVQAVKSGACECFEKPLHEDRLLKSVEAHLVRLGRPGSRSRKGLTQTEIRILQLILAGNTSRDIADELNRSKRTVDVHRKNIMRKLGATSPVDLIKRALEMGLTPRQSDREPPAPKPC
jgi:FixJ family two-component response regulator